MNDQHEPRHQTEHTQSVPVEHATQLKPDRQTHDTNQQLTRLKNLFNGWTYETTIQLGILIVGALYTWVTWGLWETSEKSLALTREQVHDGQRAYVFVEVAQLTEAPTEGKDIRFAIELKNYGLTPANHVSSRLVMTIAPTEQAAASEFATGPIVGTMPIANGQTRHLRSETIPGLSTVLDDAKMRLIQTGTHRLYLGGTLWYDDMFGKRNQTDFCWYYRGDLMLAMCNVHNTIQ